MVKNRDKNYIPKIKIVREILDGNEVAYLVDLVTDWCEGLNEHGIGVVNSALRVERDENERKIQKKIQKKLEDGVRVRAALACDNLEDAVDAIIMTKGGLKGHTLVADTKKTFSVELMDKGEAVRKKLPEGKFHVRTNHGSEVDDAGYTDGADFESSIKRKNQAKKHLKDAETPEDVAEILVHNRDEDHSDPNNMVRDTDKMSTRSQMVLNLTDLKLILFLIPGKVDFKGIEDKLPKGYEAKIQVDVREYTDMKSKEPKTKVVKTAIVRRDSLGIPVNNEPDDLDLMTLRLESKIYDGGRSGMISAYMPGNRRAIGELFWTRKDDKYLVGSVGVAHAYQRQGVASLMYRRLFVEQKISDRDLIKGHRTPEGDAFRSRAKFASAELVSRLVRRYLMAAEEKKTYKKLRIFDFDDTLVTSGGTIHVTKPNGEKVEMSNTGFTYYEREDGDEIDFTEFNNVYNPQIIKKNMDLLKEALKDPDTKVCICTARAKGAASSITKFLEENGVSGVEVAAMGSSNGQDKADWIDGMIKKYEVKDMEFFDDADKNVKAVAGMAAKHKDIRFVATFTPAPTHDSEYEGPASTKVYHSDNPRKAVMVYRKPKDQGGDPDSPAKPTRPSEWWDSQKPEFKKLYCQDHENSKYCKGAAVKAKDPNAWLKKDIEGRARKSTNPKVKKYIKSLIEKIDMAGEHAGVWIEGFAANFDKMISGKGKPIGEFKDFTLEDFAELKWVAFDADKPKKKASLDAASRIAARFSGSIGP